MDEVYGYKPRCSAVTALANTTILAAQERNAAPTAIKMLSPLLRFVNRTMRKKARRGGKGMSQISVSMVIKLLAEQSQNTSTILRLEL
jgi:hypothetical protein